MAAAGYKIRIPSWFRRVAAFGLPVLGLPGLCCRAVPGDDLVRLSEGWIGAGATL